LTTSLPLAGSRMSAKPSELIHAIVGGRK